MERKEFMELQAAPYDIKVQIAKRRAVEFYTECITRGLNYHVSVGGLDSITLLLFLRKYVDKDIVSISVTSLEDKSIQAVHKQIGITETLKPYKSKTEVLNELGFPIVSKEKARKIGLLLNPDSEKQTYIHAIMTGDMGAQGNYEHSDKIKLPDKWLKLFGANYAAHRPDLSFSVPPEFKVSNECCKYMKELPADDWAREHNSVPYLGLMASEGGQRELGIIKNGCNYFGKSTIRSCPFGIFMRQDILQLALDLEVPVPEIYGKIERKPDGTLYTTKAQRTGCSMCGFGLHLEKRPHRFDRLRERNFDEWHYWMYECCTDSRGEKYGWGRVLDYIGIPWEEELQLKLEGYN